MRGALPNDARDRRDQVEDAMFALTGVLRDLTEVELRIQQAVRRSGVVAVVLNPALERLAEMGGRLRSAQAALHTHWSIEQTERWRQGQGGRDARWGTK